MDIKGQLFLAAMREIEIKRNQYLEFCPYISIRRTLLYRKYLESVQVISDHISPIRKLELPKLLGQAIKRLGEKR